MAREITIKSGDTLGAIARANNTTVSQLAKLNNISNPNLIFAGNTLRLPEQNSGLNASDLNDSQNFNNPTNTQPDNRSSNTIFDLSATSANLDQQINAFSQQQQARAGELSDRKSKLEKEQEGTLSRFKNLLQDRPSQADLLESERERFQFDEQLGLLNDLVPDISALRQQLANLQTEEAQALESLTGQGRGIPSAIIRGQQAKVQRQYAIRQAGVSAELGAKAATAEMLRGNISLANQLINQTVEAKLYDFNQKVQDYETLFTLNQDLIDSLGAEQKQIVDEQFQLALAERDERKAELDTVAQLMMDNPNAGVSIDDTIAEASAKVAAAGGSLAARQETRIAQQALSDDSSESGGEGFENREIETSIREDYVTLLDTIAEDPFSPTADELQRVYSRLRQLYSPQEASDDAIKRLLGIQTEEITSFDNLSDEDFEDVLLPGDFGFFGGSGTQTTTPAFLPSQFKR